MPRKTQVTIDEAHLRAFLNEALTEGHRTMSFASSMEARSVIGRLHRIRMQDRKFVGGRSKYDDLILSRNILNVVAIKKIIPKITA